METAQRRSRRQACARLLPKCFSRQRSLSAIHGKHHGQPHRGSCSSHGAGAKEQDDGGHHRQHQLPPEAAEQVRDMGRRRIQCSTWSWHNLPGFRGLKLADITAQHSNHVLTADTTPTLPCLSPTARVRPT